MVDFNKLLASLNDEQAFRLPGGRSIRSLSELIDSLGSMDPKVFSEHVNDAKNDFASWIRYCFNDELLGKRISQLKSKDQIIQEIRTRVEQAKKTIESESKQKPVEQAKQSVLDIQPKIAIETKESVNVPLDDSVPKSMAKSMPEPIISSSQPAGKPLEQISPKPIVKPVGLPQMNDALDDAFDDALDDGLDLSMDSDLDLNRSRGIDTVSMPSVSNISSTQAIQGGVGIDASKSASQPKASITQSPITQPSGILDDDLDEGLDDSLDMSIDDIGVSSPSPQAAPVAPVPMPKQTTEILASQFPRRDYLDEGLDMSLDDEPVPAIIPAVITPIPAPVHDTVESSHVSISASSSGPIVLTDEEKRLLATPNEELNPAKLFKKLKLEKRVKATDSAIKPDLVHVPSQSMRALDISLTDEEKKLLATPNEELNPAKLFKKLKLEKKINIAKQQGSKEKTGSDEFIGIQLTDDERKILQTPNEALDAAKLFRKFKLEKKIKASKEALAPISGKVQEAIQKSPISEVSVSPINIIDMPESEFIKLIGINPDDDYIAEVSKKNVIRVKKKKNLLTGVPGFDDLMSKGIVEGSSILVSGGPGSGKTTFCIQQLGWAAEHGEKCLFLTLEESEERLVDHMKSYGLNPERYLEEGTLKINKLDSFKLSRSVEALLAHAKGELMIDINPIMDIIPQGFKPDRIVLDSLSSIAAAFAGQPEVYRIYVEQLFILFEKFDATSFIITEIQGSESQGHGGVEDFIADGVINFYNIKKGMKRQPALEIFKMRGVNYLKKVVPFSFVPGKGIEVYPLEEVFYG